MHLFNWKNLAILLAVVLLLGSVFVYANARKSKPYVKPATTVDTKKYITKPAKAKVYKKKAPKKQPTCVCDTLYVILQ